jgi:hypothetical protein
MPPNHRHDLDDPYLFPVALNTVAHPRRARTAGEWTSTRIPLRNEMREGVGGEFLAFDVES